MGPTTNGKTRLYPKLESTTNARLDNQEQIIPLIMSATNNQISMENKNGGKHLQPQCRNDFKEGELNVLTFDSYTLRILFSSFFDKFKL